MYIFSTVGYLKNCWNRLIVQGFIYAIIGLCSAMIQEADLDKFLCESKILWSSFITELASSATGNASLVFRTGIPPPSLAYLSYKAQIQPVEYGFV